MALTVAEQDEVHISHRLSGMYETSDHLIVQKFLLSYRAGKDQDYIPEQKAG